MTGPIAITPEQVALVVRDALYDAAHKSERSLQSADFRLGVSDIGLCHEKARRMILQIPFDEEEEHYLASFVGTAIGDHAEAALAKAEGWMTQQELSITLPSIDGKPARTILGHSDAIVPDWNMLLDFKAPGNIDIVARAGVKQGYRFQRHMYALGAIQAGLLQEEGLMVGNVFIDRTAEREMPYVDLEPFSRDVVREAAEWLEDVIYAVLNQEEARKDPPVEFCLAGETLVMTRQGLSSIRDLAEAGEAELFVPRPYHERDGWGRSGSSQYGEWMRVPVSARGIQPLRKITLTRGAHVREIYATPEHRWFVNGKGRAKRPPEEVETDALEAGMWLREVRPRMGTSALVPFAAAQGFTFGDGSTDGRVPFYEAGSKMPLLERLFSGHLVTQPNPGVQSISHVPLSWKKLPTLGEDPKFLLSWLAGYFAADGTTSDGSIVLHSAERANLEFVRSVGALCGIYVSPVKSYERNGFNGVEPLHQVNLERKALPDWFFLNPAHGDLPEKVNDLHWKVRSVEETDRVEEVYCATVPGVEAFVLDGFILTHNCEGYCAYFLSCRALDNKAEGGLLTDEEHLTAVKVYLEARDDEKDAALRKASAKRTLLGVSGSTGEYAVRWVEVGEVEVRPSVRAAHSRLSISRIRRRDSK